MSESPTMVDVARVAGVSLKTVSRVVNEEPGVSAENTARVRDAVALSDIEPTMSLGVSGGGSGPQRSASSSRTSSIAQGVEETARLSGHIVVIANSDGNPRAEREAGGMLLSRQVAGLLVVPAGTTTHTCWM